MTDLPPDVVPVIPTFVAPAVAEAELAKEGVDLRPDGGVHLWIDGTRIRLRRPRGREFRKLRESLNGVLDDWNEAIDQAQQENEAALRLGDEREARGEQRTTPEDRRADRERGRRLNEMTEDAMRGWWVELVDTLGVNPTEMDPEDWPAWMAEVNGPSQVIAHWRSVPSLSGGR